MSREIILGTRGSKLALYQTNLVLNKLQTQYPNHNFKLKKILTKIKNHSPSGSQRGRRGRSAGASRQGPEEMDQRKVR